MNKCIICNTSEAIVYSGVDALMLGVLKMVEKVCYTCAAKELETKKEQYARELAWYNTLYKEAK